MKYIYSTSQMSKLSLTLCTFSITSSVAGLFLTSNPIFTITSLNRFPFESLYCHHSTKYRKFIIIRVQLRNTRLSCFFQWFIMIVPILNPSSLTHNFSISTMTCNIIKLPTVVTVPLPIYIHGSQVMSQHKLYPLLLHWISDHNCICSLDSFH